MKRLFFTFLALFFPWLLMLIRDNPGGALVCLILQASLIGWPFATLWAWKFIKLKNENNTTEGN